jgi:pseudaminic acid synthase
VSLIEIGGEKIGHGYSPFIIAEMSGNHNQSLEMALKVVDAAASAGVRSLKLQTYTPDTITLDVNTDEFFITDEENIWKGQTLYELYKKAHTPWAWHKPLYDRCQELGLICFSTPFDETAVDFLEELNTPCYKIASFENNHLPLLKKVASTGKPVIISSGMATLSELDIAVKTLREAGCKDLILLKCTSTYPAEPVDSNLITIEHMQTLFNCPVGLSDHTLGIGVALASIALGAVVIEKHFTLTRADGGVDAAFSLEPAEMKQLVEESQRAWQSLGKISYGPTEKELASLKFRRSIYITQDVAVGDTFTPNNVKVIRPGYGLEPLYYETILGKKAKIAAKTGTPVGWDLVM